jgi:hypothetical protein
VQEHILDYLNQSKKGSLIGAVADPKTYNGSGGNNKPTETGTGNVGSAAVSERQ